MLRQDGSCPPPPVWETPDNQPSRGGKTSNLPPSPRYSEQFKRDAEVSQVLFRLNGLENRETAKEI